MSQLPAELDPLQKHRWSWKRLAGSKFFVVSVAVHLLLGMGATYYVVQRSSVQRKLTFSGGPPTTNPSKRALDHKVALGKKSRAMSAPAQMKRISVKNALAKVAVPDMPSMPAAADVIPSRMSALGGVGMGFGAGGGGGMGGGGGGGGGINFFGLRGQARSVVFVLDVSKSMVMGKKNNASYATLENEVAKAVKGLVPTLRFGMVIFAGSAEAYRETLTDSRPDEKERAISWYRKKTPTIVNDPKASQQDKEFHQGTRTDLALEKAFALKPDIIFLASDGEPSGSLTTDEILAKVQELQKPLGGRVVINVIAFMADDGQKFMQSLAAQNRGSFREVK